MMSAAIQDKNPTIGLAVEKHDFAKGPQIFLGTFAILATGSWSQRAPRSRKLNLQGLLALAWTRPSVCEYWLQPLTPKRLMRFLVFASPLLPHRNFQNCLYVEVMLAQSPTSWAVWAVGFCPRKRLVKVWWNPWQHSTWSLLIGTKIAISIKNSCTILALDRSSSLPWRLSRNARIWAVNSTSMQLLQASICARITAQRPKTSSGVLQSSKQKVLKGYLSKSWTKRFQQSPISSKHIWKASFASGPMPNRGKSSKNCICMPISFIPKPPRMYSRKKDDDLRLLILAYHLLSNICSFRCMVILHFLNLKRHAGPSYSFTWSVIIQSQLDHANPASNRTEQFEISKS